MNILITGANGYVGRNLVQLAIKNGYKVFAATRSDPQIPGVVWVKFDLSDASSFVIPSGVSSVVHLAINPRPTDDTIEFEVASTIDLYHKAISSNAQFIYLTSQASHQSSPTAYGKIKFRVEQFMKNKKGVVVRPGLVYGGSESGLFGELVCFLNKSLFIPNFMPSPFVQPIHVEDLCQGIINLINSRIESGGYALAQRDPIRFGDFLRYVRKFYLGKISVLVPIPFFLLSFFSFVAGAGFRNKIGFERFKSLYALPVMAVDHSLKELSLNLRPLSSGLYSSKIKYRRSILLEAKIIFAYLTNIHPSNIALKNYVRAIESERSGKILELKSIYTIFPFLLLFCEVWYKKTSWGEELAWRLDAAVFFLESDTKCYPAFVKNKDNNWIVELISLVVLGLTSVFCLATAIVLKPLAFFLKKKYDE